MFFLSPEINLFFSEWFFQSPEISCFFTEIGNNPMRALGKVFNIVALALTKASASAFSKLRM